MIRLLLKVGRSPLALGCALVGAMLWASQRVHLSALPTISEAFDAAMRSPRPGPACPAYGPVWRNR